MKINTVYSILRPSYRERSSVNTYFRRAQPSLILFWIISCHRATSCQITNQHVYFFLPFPSFVIPFQSGNSVYRLSILCLAK